MNQSAVEVRVSGQVQGVGFRWYCEQEALRLGVRGWVRNEPDGTVRGHFEGDPDAVDALVTWCRAGPPSARVDDVRSDPADATDCLGFESG